MYLVFAGIELSRSTELIYGNLERSGENDSLDYDKAEWKDVESDLLLGTYEEETAEKAIKKAAKEFETDEGYLYVVEIDKFEPKYLNKDRR